MKGLDRRRFLQWVWLGPAALLVGSHTACRRTESEPDPPAAATGAVRQPGKGRSRDPEHLAAELRRHFHYLELDEASLARYVRDYLRHLAPPDLAGPDFYTRFLLSTDFFQNGADESRTMQYVTFYDPYVTACRNPFARLDG